MAVVPLVHIIRLHVFILTADCCRFCHTIVAHLTMFEPVSYQQWWGSAVTNMFEFGCSVENSSRVYWSDCALEHHQGAAFLICSSHCPITCVL